MNSPQLVATPFRSSCDFISFRAGTPMVVNSVETISMDHAEIRAKKTRRPDVYSGTVRSTNKQLEESV
jgi:hypothetical protein